MDNQPTIPDKGDILIVDDNPVNLQLLSLMLIQQGYRVRSADSGPHAFIEIQAHLPDLILLDIMMPMMSGYEICKRLKEDERTRHIPVIFISALDATEDKVRGFDVGGVDYITKPFQLAEVLARVETHLALRNMQRRLEQQNMELEAQNAELDAFAHTVAHDLKNPLTALIAAGFLLERHHATMPEEKLSRYVRIVAQNGRVMNNIVDELLLLSSVRGMEEIETQPLDMRDIVTGVQDRLAYLIEERRGEIVLPDDWPMASGYAPWVEEVWANYISNALKYGGRPPHVELGGTIEINGWVRFWVRDNGRGLTSEEQERLFTPFERLHQIRAEGHGLGLSIVQRIVEKLGGQVGVESEIDRGSAFYFTLPGG
jgi:two-component system sensor histidine kinase/response regulator